MKSERRMGKKVTGILALALSLFLVLGTVAITAATTSMDEADLTSYGTAYEANLGVDDLIYISDAGAQEVWRVSPDDGTYTLYRGLGTVVDAQPDGSGRIWWTDGASDFSTLTIGTTQKTTWSFGTLEDPPSLNGVTFDNSGNLWMSEYFGSEAKIHRFNPTSNQHCTYDIPGGMPSNYIRYYAGDLYLVNWSSHKIIRFDPDTSTVQQWPVGSGVFEQGLDIDSNGLLWWANLTASLTSFNPVTNVLTSYAIPTVTGSTITMVTTSGGRIWYTDTNENTVGWLAPDQATGTTSTLTPSTTTATESCETLGAGTSSSITVESGTFDWTAGSLTTLVDSDGWTIFDLVSGANPFGIAPGGDYFWVADNGRQKLLRFLPPAETPTQNIQLDTGWNMISSFIDPDTLAIETVLSAVEDDMVLIKNGLGEVYWPDQNVNQIGTWNLEDGYQIYMTNGSTLTMSGSQVVPESTDLVLPASWSLSSYLRNTPLVIETALASISGEVYLVKNNNGEVYWPDYSVNQIGDMQPGQGYLVNMSSAGTLTYPAN